MPRAHQNPAARIARGKGAQAGRQGKVPVGFPREEPATLASESQPLRFDAPRTSGVEPTGAKRHGPGEVAHRLAEDFVALEGGKLSRQL